LARTKVITTEMMVVKKPAAFGGRQVRKITTNATSPRLLKYRGCIATAMQGKKYSNYEAVRNAFREAAKTCAGRLSEVVKK